MEGLEGEIYFVDRARNNAVIFDRATADNISQLITRQEIFYDEDRKEEYDFDDLQKIAKELLENPTSNSHSRCIIVGKNTRVFYADYERPTFDDLNRTQKPSEIKHCEMYIVIPEGVKLNGERYESGVVERITQLITKDEVPYPFANLLETYRYPPDQVTKIYQHITGKQKPHFV